MQAFEVVRVALHVRDTGKAAGQQVHGHDIGHAHIANGPSGANTEFHVAAGTETTHETSPGVELRDALVRAGVDHVAAYPSFVERNGWDEVAAEWSLVIRTAVELTKRATFHRAPWPAISPPSFDTRNQSAC